ncbi:NAD-binding protein [Streptomyces decoyicus]
MRHADHWSEPSAEGLRSLRPSWPGHGAGFAGLRAAAGFTGSEMASVCRARDLEMTVAERAPAPLVGALGEVVAAVAARLQHDHGVDVRWTRDAGCFDVNRARRCTVRRHLMITGMRRRAAG